MGFRACNIHKVSFSGNDTRHLVPQVFLILRERFPLPTQFCGDFGSLHVGILRLDEGASGVAEFAVGSDLCSSFRIGRRFDFRLFSELLDDGFDIVVVKGCARG